VSPYFQAETEEILHRFDGLKKALLVVPKWNGKNGFSKDFISATLGHELILHGYTHFCKKPDFLGKAIAFSSTSHRELKGLLRLETENLIRKGIGDFEDYFNERPAGFIPPTWLHNKHSMLVLKDFGFSYTETVNQLIDLRKVKKYASPAVCTDYGRNHLLEQLSLSWWKYYLKQFNPTLIRFSIHPSDASKKYLSKLSDMINVLHEKDYRFVTYSEFLA
jgi:predicted deacetylase